MPKTFNLMDIKIDKFCELNFSVFDINNLRRREKILI